MKNPKVSTITEFSFRIIQILFLFLDFIINHLIFKFSIIDISPPLYRYVVFKMMVNLVTYLDSNEFYSNSDILTIIFINKQTNSNCLTFIFRKLYNSNKFLSFIFNVLYIQLNCLLNSFD